MTLLWGSSAIWGTPEYTWDGTPLVPAPAQGGMMRFPPMFLGTRPPGPNLVDPLGVVSHLTR